MACVNIEQYSLTWNTNTNLGTIGLWFVGAQVNPNAPHQTLTNLRSDQYVAISHTLRGDTDHKTFFDRQTGLWPEARCFAVTVGAGVRLPPRNLVLFEVVINAIRKAAQAR